MDGGSCSVQKQHESTIDQELWRTYSETMTSHVLGELVGSGMTLRMDVIIAILVVWSHIQNNPICHKCPLKFPKLKKFLIG